MGCFCLLSPPPPDKKQIFLQVGVSAKACLNSGCYKKAEGDNIVKSAQCCVKIGKGPLNDDCVRIAIASRGKDHATMCPAGFLPLQ